MTLGSWTPMQPDEVLSLFTGANFHWWISGGWALDLFIGQKTREHVDIDVLVLREEASAIQEWLSGWDLHLATNGSLANWTEGTVPLEGTNDVWCRPSIASPWVLQLNLADAPGNQWRFRRNPIVTLPLSGLGQRTSDGIPYVAPQVVLLFKASAIRYRDGLDFDAVVPLLNSKSRSWLASSLAATHPGHTWLRRL